MSRSTERTTPSGAPTRRRFLKQIGLAGVALGPGSALLASCVSGSTDEPDDEAAASPAGEITADNPLGIATDGEVEIWIFDGGFTDAYAVEIHEPLLQQRWPDLTIDHHKAVDIGAELQQRFVAGDPPDFINNSGDGQLDTAQLIANGQLADLGPLLDAPSWDDPGKTVRETLVPGTVEVGSRGGVCYELNYAFTLYGLWYNKALFDTNGWTVPRTWDDMLDLCAEIKSAGIAPWTYQGLTAPYYMNWPLLTMAAKQGGVEVLKNIDNLVEGAWKDPSVLAAAEAIYRLAENGYFMEGTEGMEFRDAQAAWVQGEAAIVPAGSWLENEEVDLITARGDEFQIAYMNEPIIDEASAALPYETLRAKPSTPYVVPADAAHPEAGMEYMRAMLSKEGAQGFTNMVKSFTSVLGAADGVELDAPGLSSAKDAFTAAGENVVNWLYPLWYPSMESGDAGNDISGATFKLLKGDVNPEEWADLCEGVATKWREDDAIQHETHA
ncbi:carbohydrate ABC transporter, N-acetylglucosamine/diacetylchitobiose-binding protein [Phytoactinopolyspora alkaliphila]|uniref:Carbohydrate ABC transporter, N-acetylglucosamine/diacetylchitobiose-binding protein n=1 Tax=Phytoactinopolyspora alkaliphila TaxID=1783498 RepID=A0A6N9YSP0_9ACTN|nr:N-acetylglucosamine/diacetylchitobiose ABC transporter substrate-binding protein [Phytoactinopolyspora alkaliphila]NED97848.1 carbohydrate ABC transporter, N-acetylglucosamine/diacetylchitobiose-binding protein [Phytoactinopolyspora alkaliphila]